MRNKPLLIAVCSLIVVSFNTYFCDEVTPSEGILYCDALLDDPYSHRNAILSNPVINQLDEKLATLDVTIYDCISDNAVEVFVEYIIPSSYSQYGFQYSDKLHLTYSLTGTLKLNSFRSRKPVAFDTESILKFFENKIQEFETNPKIQEFLSRIDQFPQNRDLTRNISRGYVGLHGYRGSITYNFSSKNVWKYTLPNSIEWHEFPEISQAHAILEGDLLTGELSNCTIDRDEKRSYTDCVAHGSSLALTISLDCAGRREPARLRRNPDGSYELLGIGRLEKPIPPTSRSLNPGKAIRVKSRPRKDLQKNYIKGLNPLGDKPLEPNQPSIRKDDNQIYLPLNNDLSEEVEENEREPVGGKPATNRFEELMKNKEPNLKIEEIETGSIRISEGVKELIQEKMNAEGGVP